MHLQFHPLGTDALCGSALYPSFLVDKPAKARQHVLNNSAKSLIFESFIPRQSLGLEIGGGRSAAAGAAGVGVVSRAESISGGSDHG